MERRDKASTKNRILDAVRVIFLEEGILGIGVNKIAKQAQVDKKLIYRYFNNLEGLLAEFISQHDIWHTIVKNTADKLNESTEIKVNHMIDFLFDKQFDLFFHNRILHQLTLWSITETNQNAIEGMMINREIAGRAIFKKIDDLTMSSDKINYRAVAAILIAGIYFLSLRAHANRNTFCGINLSDELGRQEIKSAVRLINELVFNTEK